jgi:hypothetical protein
MSEQIEMMGINILENCLLKTGYLIPYILKNDRTPSWDGSVWLYKNQNLKKKKSDFEDRIPVQVKSTINHNINDEQITYNLKKLDLNSYLKDGGIIYFVIRISDSNNYAIYYNRLNPLKIKMYIKQMEKKKSINSKFDTFPKDNINEIVDIFFNFSFDRNKQPFNEILSQDDFIKFQPQGFYNFSLHYHGIQQINPNEYLIDREITLYANHSETNYSIPIDLINISEIGPKQVNTPVILDNIEYYPNYNIYYSKEGIKIIIGNSFTFLFLKNIEKLKFKYKIHGYLSDRITEMKFFLALIKNKYITIALDDKELLIVNFNKIEENIDLQKEYEKLNIYLNYLLEINKVLEILRIDSDINLDIITKKDEENIQLLISGILYKKHQSLAINNENIKGSFRGIVTVCNITVSLLFIKEKNNKYSLQNFFNDGYIATYQKSSHEIPFNVSIFLVLTKNEFLTISNIDYDMIYRSFIILKTTEDLFEMTNLFILEMISAYDQSKNNILLDTSLKLINWILDNGQIPSNEVYILNKMQIIKRMNNLSEYELSQLHNIISTSKEDKNITAAYLLLGDINLATIHFKKLPENEQVDFNNWPIHIFWKK